MKNQTFSALRSLRWPTVALFALLAATNPQTHAASATLLFQEDFNNKLAGWTAVKPAGGAYLDGDMLWVFNKLSDSFGEQSNLYTDSSAGSVSRIGSFVINDTVAPASGYSYSARLNAGDDDGFGLIWGYESENNFYRITFATQSRAAGVWPAQGLWVDRMSNNVPVNVFGPDSTFVATRGRPFDVTIAVTNSLLTLTVVDDPLGSPAIYTFNTEVTPIALPTTPSGKVGIFSWGMSGAVSPANFMSFRISNLVLSPTPLVNGNPAILTDWSFLTPPGGAGTVNAVNETVWGIAMDVNGERGTLINVDDQAPNNVAPFTTNFPAPSAVAGDVNWSNYVYSARFVLADNDGFGMLLRYQDETNFYRLAFRQQNAQTGIKRGLTVQKNANPGAGYEQIYSNAVAGFIPPYVLNTKQVFEVHAFIQTNRLQIIAVSSPDTAPTTAASGPINMASTPGTVDKGKIGVFSWAQFGDAGTTIRTGTEVDWVKVRQVTQEGLLVSSPFGTPDPPAGLNDLPLSGSVTARVDSVVTTAPGVRQLSTGWAGAGSVPATGTTNEVSFTLGQFSLIAWKWQKQFQLSVSASVGGTAVPSAGPWINSGSNVTVTATANAGSVFTGWSGDIISRVPVLNLSMIRPYTLTAHFAVDSDNDGLADDWELQYFGNLTQAAAGDPDGDLSDNLAEFQAGTNPATAANTVFTDGLSSRWINECRDRAIPGQFVVTNFGNGFRGLWEVSNQNRGADSAGAYDGLFISTTNYATNASFQGPFIVVRTNVWNPSWANTFSLSAEYSVGDNDGDCLYFRYQNESNWFRVNLCGNDAAAPTRPLQGLSIQKRTNGWFSAVTPTATTGNLGFYPDPLDAGGYKRFRVTVNATNDTFEVRVIGWSVLLDPNDWDPASEIVATFTDGSLPTGRIGVGPWGQGGFGAWNSSTNDPQNPGVLVNPVGAGMFVDNIILQVNGTNAFVEDWETATLHTDLPAGWDNPYAGTPGYAGDWHVSAHATLANFTLPFGTPQTGTTEFPKADAEGPILLAPSLTNQNYLLELGIHPLDDGGMGFVYDFKDTNNFSRVLFNSQVPLAGQLAQGLNVSRKSGGVWTDIVVGDNTFIYTPGRHFDVRFANNNGTFTLSAWNTDAPGTVYHWQWAGQPVNATNRFGLGIWDMPDAHYDYVRARDLVLVAPPVPLAITNIMVTEGNVILGISKPAGSNYHVLRATSVLGPYLTNAANQSAAQYTEPQPVGSPYFYRLQYAP